MRQIFIVSIRGPLRRHQMVWGINKNTGIIILFAIISSNCKILAKISSFPLPQFLLNIAFSYSPIRSYRTCHLFV